MARAQGARAQMALGFETVYGTPPVSGFRLMPFARATLGAEQPLLESELLGYGRDPLAPIKDAVTADGEVVIPIDVEAFGFWLKAAFGQPTTSGTTPKTHTFQSGNWTLPSMSIETAMPEVPRFAMYSGCVLDQLSWQMQRSGLLTATARLIAQGETIAATTAAGTPTALALQRFGHFNGTVKRNGTALGNVVSAEITYSNNLDRIETIRGDGRIDGADPTMAALTGRIEVRFSDTTLVTQAIDGSPCELEFNYSLGANASFTFTAHAVFGRLSREMDLANARVAAFAGRATLAAAAAIAALAAAGAAMVGSGLQTVDAQAKLAQSLGTTVASIQTLERAGELAGVSMSGIEQATKDLTRRLSQAAAGTGPAADALDRLGLSASDLIALPLDQRVAAINAAIEAFVPAAERAAVAGQLFGEEGSIAMSRIDTATLGQATEDVLAFGVVVSEQDADQIERTNDAISRLGLIWRGVSNQLAVAAAPALEAVANALASVARTTGPVGIAITALFDNIGRLTTYAAAFAAVMAGRWVAGMAVAALSVRGLATALVFLRGALIRTGIGALIVGAGELVYQFTRLMAGAGGFGNAMGLLSDLASEV